MQRKARLGHLYLNGIDVGTIDGDNGDSAFAFGRFSPAESFSQFASLFGAWSLLVHEIDGQTRLDEQARADLREAERAIDQLNAALVWEDGDAPIPLTQLNIDADMIEWRSLW